MSRSARPVLRMAVDFGLPTAAYYAMRGIGFGTYAALLLAGLVSAVQAAVPLVRSGRLDGMAAYVTTMVVGALAVSLIPGNTRFLLARQALLTGVTGAWFIASVRSRRTLAYLFSKPMLEGRMRWPARWDELWERSAGFRRMWRVSSVMWGIGLLVVAALRVVIAYTLPPDAVPAVGAAIHAGTSVLLILITNIHFVASGVYDRGSALYPQRQITEGLRRASSSRPASQRM